MDTHTTSSSPAFDHWQQLQTEGRWTPSLRAFARTADSVRIAFRLVTDAPSWQGDAAFVEVRFRRKSRDGATEEEMTAEFAGYIGRGYCDRTTEVASEGWLAYRQYSRDDSNRYSPYSGAWAISLYPGQSTHAGSCFSMLPTGSSLIFRTRLDYHTSPLLVDAKLHGDALLIQCDKGKRRLEVELETATVLHNSARFGSPRPY